MTLIEKVKQMLKAYQEEHGKLDDKDYEKMFVHFYLKHQDEYRKDSSGSFRSDGKKRYWHVKGK